MYALRAPSAFDGETFLRGGATVFVEQSKIVGVEAVNYPIPVDVDVLGYADATVLPGLIDTHVHLVCDGADGALDRVAGYSETDIERVLNDSLNRQLAAGVTTVRDLGDWHWCVQSYRSGRSGETVQPTIVASGPPVTTVGGHCHFLGGAVHGHEEIRTAVQDRRHRGVDVVKVMTSGGFVTPGTDVMRPQFSDEDLQLLVDQSHDAGLAVVAHAHAVSAVEQAVMAGVDGIEHLSCITAEGFSASDDLLDAVADRSIAVSLTMGHDHSQLGSPPPHVQKMLDDKGWTVAALWEALAAHRERVLAAEVSIHCGTDAGIAAAKPHGVLPLGIVQHVERGLSTRRALAGATSFAAEVCGLADRKGRLAAGYDADVLVVHGELQEVVSAVTQPALVVLAGKPIQATQIEVSPE
jgi:imidazolonepropionase-like amidohydrolase